MHTIWHIFSSFVIPRFFRGFQSRSWYSTTGLRRSPTHAFARPARRGGGQPGFPQDYVDADRYLFLDERVVLTFVRY